MGLGSPRGVWGAGSEGSPQVLDFGWPELLAPPLELLCSVCKALEGCLGGHPRNVAVLLCKVGEPGGFGGLSGGFSWGWGQWRQWRRSWGGGNWAGTGWYWVALGVLGGGEGHWEGHWGGHRGLLGFTQGYGGHWVVLQGTGVSVGVSPGGTGGVLGAMGEHWVVLGGTGEP